MTWAHLKTSLLIHLFCIYLPTNLIAQPLTPKDYGLKEFSITDISLGLIRFYVDIENINIKQPLFIDVNGSGGLPLCIYIKGKGFGATFNTFSVPLKDAIKNNYHYIILDKPGTPFCDSILTDDDAKHYDKHTLVSNNKFSKEYSKRLSLGWRVAATKKVITYMIKHGFWDGTQIVADGYSEGAQVVPSLAVVDKRVTHIVAMVGSGLNQLYDGIMAWRIKAAKGEITHQQAQVSINANLKTIKDIYHHPESTKLEYEGHTYKRWASFGLNPPFEKLRMLNIPIYMIVSTADNSSPIFGLNYVELDFIRLGKTNLIYDTCVGCDHYFNRTDTSSIGSPEDFNAKILRWLGK
jgi:hypothetical protein